MAAFVFLLAFFFAAPLRPGYAGDGACVACHQQIEGSYHQTAHFHTSELPSSAGVGGVRAGHAATLTIHPAGGALPPLAFTVEARGGVFEETVSTGSGPDRFLRTEPIAFVTGSGRHGRSYLYWQADALFELPVSLWSVPGGTARWINSPGFTDGTADFARPIAPGCLECHASYIAARPGGAPNRFVPDSFEPGIGCETCHGPGAAHVAQPTKANILNPKTFTRAQQIDLCALCHNGIAREALQPAFSYRPGKPLAEFFRPLPVAVTDAPDVHGNQVALLERSRCFTGSAKMTCSTCHNTHEPELVSAAAYSPKCLSCHQWQSCGVAKTLGPKIQHDCVNCHMPLQQTAAIVSTTAGVEVSALIRTHWIKVYPRAAGAGQAVH